MLPNCLSVHSNMAPAAQVRRQERGDRGEGVGVGGVGWWKEVSLTLSFHLSLSLFFFCDGCKAVDHAPDLSVFLIKILYLQAREEKKGGKHSVNNQLWEERKREAIADTSTQCDTHGGFKYNSTRWKSLDLIRGRLTHRSNPKGLKEATHLCYTVFMSSCVPPFKHQYTETCREVKKQSCPDW